MNKISIKVAEDDNDFVGLIIEKNNTTIIFPIGYDIKEEIVEWDIKNGWTNEERIESIKHNVRNLMNILDKTEIDYYDKGNIKFTFSSAMYIIEDYLKNGLYKENLRKKEINGSGKIDWMKTINSIEPIFSKNGYFYNNVYTIKKRPNENKITQIQKYCLAISLKVLKWMYNINGKFSIIKPFNDDEMIYELSQELYTVNEDKKKQILKEMIYFIQGTNSVKIQDKEEFAIGRNKFDKVWEELLRKQIYELYDEFDCKPKTYYHINSNNGDRDNSKLLPDIVVKKDSKIVIIDAKYYKKDSLPQSSDICKQLFYGKYMKKNYTKYIIDKDNKQYIINNIFLLPKRIPNEKIEEYGYAYVKEVDKKEVDEKVDVFYIDTKSVIESNTIVKDLMKKIMKM